MNELIDTPEAARLAFELNDARYWLRRAKDDLVTANANLDRAQFAFDAAVKRVEELESKAAVMANEWSRADRAQGG